MNHFIFADVHGRFDRLKELTDLLPENTQLYSLGDLIDRGPNSKEVIEFCIENKVIACMGNHEEWVINLLHFINLPNTIYASNAIDRMARTYFDSAWAIVPTLTSYGITNNFSNMTNRYVGLRNFAEGMPPLHKKFFKSLLLYNILDAGPKYKKLLLCHSGLSKASIFSKFESGENEFDQLNDTLCLLDDDKFYFQFPNLNKPDTIQKFYNHVQIFGHQPKEYIRYDNHFLGLDTGCGIWPEAPLTGLLISNDKFEILNSNGDRTNITYMFLKEIKEETFYEV